MITFLGDIALLNSNISSEYITEGDYIANFEYVCDNNNLTPVPGKINISSSYYDFESIFGAKPIALNVANNHILDYGIDGFMSTINTINLEGISTIGDKTYWYNDNTCILAYTLFYGEWQGVDIVQFSKEKAKREIIDAVEKGAKCVIVCMHWGIENYSLPDENQKEIGRWLIDEGVDIVIGHHPHCIQPIEKYKGGYIVYSLGNCIFPPFSLDCFYDNEGISHRRYRFKWRKWNNRGLAVVYDEKNKTMIKVDELYYDNNMLYCTQQDVPQSKYMLANAIRPIFAKFQFKLRKYWLFFVSNSFVDGKLFDITALKSELKK